jgi:alkylation response protein AidB-like acyl-CoA dehydrogenase
VRAFLEAELPQDLQHKVLNHLRLGKDDYVRWHRILARRGWAAPGWPQEFGGPGWTAAQRHIFEEECARAGTPRRRRQTVTVTLWPDVTPRQCHIRANCHG